MSSNKYTVVLSDPWPSGLTNYSLTEKHEELRLFAEATGKEHIGSPKSNHQTTTSERETRFLWRPATDGLSEWKKENHKATSSANFFPRTFLSFFIFSSLGKNSVFWLVLPRFFGGQERMMCSSKSIGKLGKQAKFVEIWFCFERGGLICKGDSLGLLLWFSLFPLMGIVSMGVAGGFGFAWTGAAEMCLGAEGSRRLCGDFL